MKSQKIKKKGKGEKEEKTINLEYLLGKSSKKPKEFLEKAEDFS